MNTLLANTPCDSLFYDKQRLGPSLLLQPGGPTYDATYGFSTKESYDVFIANSDLPLTPYPLVKGYLRNHIAESDTVIPLVVIDASGPLETQLNAASMKVVLEAQEKKADQVAISFRLTLDQDSQAYRVQETLQESESPRMPIETQRPTETTQ